MSVLILAKLGIGTGNKSTATRIRDSLQAAGYECFLDCLSNLKNQEETQKLIEKRNIKYVIGINAYRVGHCLTDCRVPFIIIFGGTDLNEFCHMTEKMVVMSTVVSQCRYAVAFNKPMKEKACYLWPEIKDKVLIIPQGLSVSPSSFSLNNYLEAEKDNLGIQSCNNNIAVLLLVSGLREVKDPLFLARVVSEWHQEDSKIFLFIVGPQLDEKYARHCEMQIKRLSGVVILSVFNQNDLFAMMKASTAVVNSSISEGMPTTVIEAMLLGTPVIARNNEGCADLIKHRETGLLYETPQEFRSLAEELLSSRSLRERIVSNAKNYATENHDVANEKAAYSGLIANLMKTKGSNY